MHLQNNFDIMAMETANKSKSELLEQIALSYLLNLVGLEEKVRKNKLCFP